MLAGSYSIKTDPKEMLFNMYLIYVFYHLLKSETALLYVVHAIFPVELEYAFVMDLKIFNVT